MIACPDCGLIEELPPLRQGTNAECVLCGADLERTSGRSITAALGCALGTFFLLFPGNILLLMSVRIFGMHNQSRLSTGVFALWDHDWILLAALTGAFAVFLPFLRFGLLSTVLAIVRLGYRPAWLGSGFRWAIWLDVWAMPDVYLLAGLSVITGSSMPGR
jgi:paraquat-inducible protein A